MPYGFSIESDSFADGSAWPSISVMNRDGFFAGLKSSKPR